jgi:uncharacterized protein YecE (DUF72 family)
MKKEFRIGCSGYYYPAWKNKFYPQGLQPRNWLQYYSTVFNTVELNGTFYRVPKLADLKKFSAATPDDFRFSVKMNKTITHLKKLKGTQELITEFQDLILEGLGDKLSCFLFQMPPSFHCNEENTERLAEHVPKTPNNIVELRHESWWNEETKKLFKKNKFTFCNVDFPGLRSYFISTSKVFYLRLHGNPELFKSSYSNPELEAFVKLFPDDCKQYNIFFNNTYYDAGYKNALELKKILEQDA